MTTRSASPERLRCRTRAQFNLVFPRNSSVFRVDQTHSNRPLFHLTSTELAPPRKSTVNCRISTSASRNRIVHLLSVHPLTASSPSLHSAIGNYKAICGKMLHANQLSPANLRFHNNRQEIRFMMESFVVKVRTTSGSRVESEARNRLGRKITPVSGRKNYGGFR